MIVVRVELHSANTREVTELARMYISNESEPDTPRNGLHRYLARALRGRSTNTLNNNVTQRSGHVLNYPAERIHVWHLVYACLAKLGYQWEDTHNGNS